MKLLPLGLATLLAGPALAQTCQLTGDITGLGTRKAEYTYTRQGQPHTDSVHVVNGRFALPIKGGDGDMGTLILRDARTPGFYEVPIWVEPGTVSITGSAAEPGRLTASGTPENNVLADYQRMLQAKIAPPTGFIQGARLAIERQTSALTCDFVRAHPAARASAYLLLSQAYSSPDTPAATYRTALQSLTPAVRQSWFGQQAAKRIQALENQPTVGKSVPSFVMADTAGVKHSLATYRGKYVLLDFWGHWCKPCIEAMPKVSALHKQYADKLAIIGIAMEGANSAPRWKQAIRQHAVPGLQLSELQANEGPVITGYNITAFPTYLLLDPQGKLVARTSDVEEITKKLASLTDL